ncbi:MAG: hypothetical protein RLZZ534_1367 [Actinomycetota bacterium]
MTGAAVAVFLSDGRLHLQHGPIDLIIEANGDAKEISIAYDAMAKRFETVLDELVLELKSLRQEVSVADNAKSPIAKRMIIAALKFNDEFVTPMAAVAGSVADEIVEIGWTSSSLKKLYVNNGGDIAFRVGSGEQVVVGVTKSVIDPTLIGRLHFSANSNVRGVATSGFGGRSRTFGIADAVTVVSSCAAAADVAATLIANHVSLGDHPQVKVIAANLIDESSDLGDRLVTSSVGNLTKQEIETALDKGEHRANELYAKQLISGAFLALRGSVRSVGKFDFNYLVDGNVS